MARKLAQQQRQLPALTHARELHHVALDDQLDVVVEPARAIRRLRAAEHRRESPRDNPADVLLAGERRKTRIQKRLGIAQEHFAEVLADARDLALREREDVHPMRTPGERLGGSGKRRVARRARQHESPRSAVAVELGLDRIE